MTLSLRDRRHQRAKADLSRLESRRDVLLDRLALVAARIKKARRSIQHYERTPAPPAAKPAEPANVGKPVPPPASQPATPAPAPANHDDLEVPTFLQRNGNGSADDIAALAEIEAGKASQRIADKASAEIEIAREADKRWRNWVPGKNAKGKTKLTRPPIRSFVKEVRDERKRMPLTGKAALEKIRAG